jgi:hypothetical protein
MAKSTARMRQHRRRVRNQGYSLIPFIAVDTQSEAFIAECRRQMLVLHNDPKEKEILDWMEQVQDYSGWSY